MLALTDKANPNDDVIVTELDSDEAVLLHLDTKMYFSLNATGVWIWRQLGNELTLGDIVTKLQNEFDVMPDKAKESVINLVEQLQQEQLIDIVNA